MERLIGLSAKTGLVFLNMKGYCTCTTELTLLRKNHQVIRYSYSKLSPIKSINSYKTYLSRGPLKNIQWFRTFSQPTCLKPPHHPLQLPIWCGGNSAVNIIQQVLQKSQYGSRPMTSKDVNTSGNFCSRQGACTNFRIFLQLPGGMYTF